MKKFYTLLFGCLLLSSIAFAQGGPVTTAPILNGCPASSIEVPVTVSSFNNVGGISLTLNYDPAILLYQNVVLNPIITGSIVNGSVPGTFILSFSADPGVNLADNSTLFTLIFNYAGPTNGGSTSLTWLETPTEANEYSDVQGIPYDKTPFASYFINGSVTVIPTDCGPVTTTPTFTTCALDPIAVPVTVNDMYNVGGISHTLHYNPAILSYQSVTLHPSIATSIADGSVPGTFILSYSSLVGLNLPDNTVLYTLYFNYVGPPTGGSSTFTWSSTPEEANEYSTPEGIPYNKTPFGDYFEDGEVTVAPLTCGPMTIAPVITTCPQAPIYVPVVVNDIYYVGGISLTLNYDPAVLQYQGVTLHPSITGSITNGATPGTFLLSYTSDPLGLYLPDNTVLFTLEFAGACPGTTAVSPLTWAVSPTEANEYADPAGFPYDKDPFSSYFIDGSVTITTDLLPPDITTVAGTLDRSLLCGDATGLSDALALAPAATDNCTNPPAIHLVSDVTTPTPGCPTAYQRVRTWNFTDYCNNTSADFVQTITVSPAALPTFPAVQDITVACGAAVESDLTYDNGLTGPCQITGTVTSTLSAQNPAGYCGGDITETWEVTICGNLVTQSRTIHVEPALMPWFPSMPDITVACGGAVQSDLTYDNGLTGDCQITGTVTSNLSPQDPAGYCGGEIVETWQVTICGNLITRSRTITVEPALLPSFLSVTDITVACGEAVESDLTYDNGLTGDCQITGTVTSNLSTQNPAGYCGGDITETWEVTVCGNIITQSRTIHVLPAALPVFATVSDITVACGEAVESDLTYDNGLTGDCQITGTVTSNLSTQNPAGYCGGDITETWEVTVCGNLITQSRTIHVLPAALPVFATVSDITVACGEAVESDLTYDNGLTGDCQITGTVSSNLSAQDPAGFCGGDITETWQVTVCGNLITQSRTIHVEPALMPWFPTMPDITVACGGAVQSDLTYDNGLTGDCQITGTVTSNLSPQDPAGYCGGEIIETWQVTVCGNLITRSRTITVEPALLPSFMPVTDITVACGEAVESDLTYDNGLTGDCQITGTVGSNLSAQNPAGYCGGDITETWEVDICGNLITQSRTIHVLPADLPVMTAPGEITVDCNQIPAPSTLSFTNNLGGDCLITGTSDPSTFNVVIPGFCDGLVVETWTATDQCGRPLASVSRNITVHDGTAPEIYCHAGPEVRTILASQPGYTAVGTEFDPTSMSDNCGVVTAVNNLNGLATLDGYLFPVGVTTVTWTATDGCLNTAQCSFNVEVYACPEITQQPEGSVICRGTTANMSVSALPGTYPVTYQWQRSAVGCGSGFADIPGATNANYTTSSLLATTWYQCIITPNQDVYPGLYCQPVVTDCITVEVNPLGQVNQPATQVVCIGTSVGVTFSTINPGGITTYAWTNTQPGIGLPANGSGDISFIATNAGTAPLVGVIVVTPTYSNGGTDCTGPSRSFTITVNPDGQVNAPANIEVCDGTLVAPPAFSTVNTGGTTTYTWVNSNPSIGLAAAGNGNLPIFTAINPGTTPVVATITVTPTFERKFVSCQGQPVSFTITVLPTPDATATPSSQVICSGSPITTIVNSSNIPGSLFNWFRNNYAGVTGIPTSGSGDISGILTNTTYAPVTVTFTIIPQTNPVSETLNESFTTFPLPSGWGAQNLSDPLGSGTWFQGNNTVFTANTPPNYIGVNYQSGSGLSTLSNWLFMPPALLKNGDQLSFYTRTVDLEPPYVYPDRLQVRMNSTNTGANVGAGSTSVGDFTELLLDINPTYQMFGYPDAWTQFIVTLSGLPVDGVNGRLAFRYFVENGGPFGDNSNYIGIDDVVYSTTGLSCSGPPITATVTINPIPDAQIDPAAQTICNGTAITSIVPTGHVNGTVFNWTRDNMGTVTGIAETGTGTISGSLTNTTNQPVTVTFTVTPEFTNAGLTCTGTPVTATVVVNPTAQVTQPDNETACIGDHVAVEFKTLTLGGTTTYDWVNTETGIGLAANGNGDISFQAQNAGTAPLTGLITVTPTFTNGGISCQGPAESFTITVNPSGQVNDPSDLAICNGTTVPEIVFGTVNTGGTTTFDWTNDLPGIGLAAAGSGNVPEFNAINTGNSPVTAVITVTPTFTNNGVSCTGTPEFFSILVNPSGQVNDVADQELCSGEETQVVLFSTTNLMGSTVYTWTNSNTTIGLAAEGTGDILPFIATNTGPVPAIATIIVTPHYTYDELTCDGPTQEFTITVNEIPVLVTHPQSVCSPSKVNLTLPAVTAGSTLNGGILSYWMDAECIIPVPNPAAVPTGTYYIKAETLAGCFDVESVTAQVNPLPTTYAGTGSGSYCAGGAGLAVGLAGSQVGVSYTLYLGLTPMSPTVAGTGGPISFGIQTAAGEYWALAQNTSTGCISAMYSCVTIVVNPVLPVSVTIVASANPVSPGTPVNFTATPVNGGTSPVFEWFVNGGSVGTNSNTYTYVPANHDMVYCILTSDLTCVSGNPATSNTIVMSVVAKGPGAVFVAPVKVDPGITMKVYPNPTSGRFTLEQVSGTTTGVMTAYLCGLRGDVLSTVDLTHERKAEISLADLPQGIYYVRVVTEGFTETYKVVKTR